MEGALPAAPGVVWEASDTTCDKHHNEANGDYYTNCAGLDVTIPMSTVESGRTSHAVTVLFQCKAFGITPLDAELYVGSSFSARTWAPGDEPIHVEALSEHGEAPVIKIKLAPTNADALIGPSFFGTCTIELKENSHKSLEDPLGQYDYAFTGEDNQDQTCSTGTQRFGSLASVCVALQSPVGNPNNCALSERLTRFVQQCKPAGYSFIESHSCEIGLYSRETQLSVGPIPKEGRLAHAKYCVGRQSSGMDIGSLVLSGVTLSPGAQLTMTMTFVPEAQRASEAEINRFQLLNGDGTAAITDEITMTSGIVSQRFGPTRDEQFQYAFSCGAVWSCDP